jgi:hypothetical protein
MSSGPSKVIVLDPDPRAGRQVQLGFEREGMPVVVPALAAGGGALDITDEPALVLVGGADAATGLDLVRRARTWLDAKGADVPLVFAGHGASRREGESAGADEVVARPAFLRDLVTIGRVLRGVPRGERDHLTGNLVETTGVLTLVRALSALGRSAVLTLIRGLRRGEVRFFHGEVTSAQVGLIHGQAALHQLLLWTDARFDYAHEDIVRRHQIPLSSEELFADAERFLEAVREHAGALSPATVLEQDVVRVQTLGKQIPTEVHGVLRMFDGHRVLADILEDSPYRVFETLRVAQKAVEVGLLRPVSSQRPKATWRAVLAIEEWLVGSETREAVVERTQALDSGPVKATPPRKKQRGKRRGKRAKTQPTPSELKTGDIDWGALVPRVIGAEVGPLSGVVPAHEAHGEVELPTRDAPREGLEALMDTQKRDRIFPTDIGIEPSIVVAEEPGVVVEPVTPAKTAPATPATIATSEPAATPSEPEPPTSERTTVEQVPLRRQRRAERGDDLALEVVVVDDSRERRDTARHAAPPPPAGTEVAAAEVAAAPSGSPATSRTITDRHAAPPPGTATEVNASHAAARPERDTARHAAPLRPPAIAAPRISDTTLDTHAEKLAAAAAEPAASTTSSADSAAPAVPNQSNGSKPTRAPSRAASPSVEVDPEMASLIAVPTHVEPMKSDPVAAVTAVPPEVVVNPRTRKPGATDAGALVRALVAEVVPPSETSDAVTAPVRPNIDEVVTAPVARPASIMTAAFERIDQTPPPNAMIAEPITVDEADATSVAVTDVVTVSGSRDTAVITASPQVMISEIPTLSPVASTQPARSVASPDDATPIETDDEPSDGVVRATIASKADTARISRPRIRASVPEHDGPPVKSTSGEVSERAKRPTKEPDISEPTILVADLAAAHDAVAAAVAAPRPATPPPPDAASPSRELAVSDVRRDAVAFSESEEAFFRGAERTAPAPKVETFSDLDEDYEPPKFWDRVFGRKKKK